MTTKYLGCEEVVFPCFVLCSGSTIVFEGGLYLIVPTTTTEVLATAPVTFPNNITNEPKTGLRILGLPAGLVVVLAAFVLVAVVLSIVLTRRNKQEESDHL